jgi:hypothetical protein
MGPRPRDLADVGGFPAFAAEVVAANREWVGSHGNKGTKLREQLQSEGISLGDFPPVVLKNRWHQLQTEDRSTEFTGYHLQGLIFGRPEVIGVFDQRDAPTDEAAEAAV